MIENNNFFSGIEFRAFGHNSQATECMNRQPFFYGVQYVHSGSFYLTVNNRKYNLRGPAAFITAPGVDFAYGSPPGTSRYHCHVCFTGERVERYLNGNLFKLPHLMEEPFIAISNPQQFLNDMLELILMLQNGENGDFAVAKLEYILLSLKHQQPTENQEYFHQPRIEELARRIMTHPEQEWDFTAEAAKLNISLKHFMRIFQAIHKHPPRRFVLRQRLFKAQEMLLKNGNVPIKMVAYECGFSNEFYFSRIFKKYMSSAPETFRKKHTKGQL
jgi:AraC-like DNA-binding protein